MIARPTVLLALLALHHAPAAADEPKAFACSFTAGVTHAYDKGQFTAEKASPLAFGIAAIDHTAQTADLRMEGGAGALRVVQAVNATHFLEVATEGFLNITTIYDKDEAKGGWLCFGCCCPHPPPPPNTGSSKVRWVIADARPNLHHPVSYLARRACG
jgi:hypothetical protein